MLVLLIKHAIGMPDTAVLVGAALVFGATNAVVHRWWVFIVSTMALWLFFAGFELRTVPVSTHEGDMLPLIGKACDSLLSGQQPYRTYEVPWSLHLCYPPGQWLPYVPCRALSCDVRITNLLCVFAIYASLVAMAAGLGGRELWPVWRAESRLHCHAWKLLPIVLFLCAPFTFWAVARTEVPVEWAIAAVFLALLHRGRHVGAAVCLSLLLVTRPLSVLLLGTVGIFLLVHGARSRRHRARCLAALMLPGWAVLLPFAIAGGWAVLSSAMGLGFYAIARDRWVLDHCWARQIGLAGPFYMLGKPGMLLPIQLAACAAVWWARRSHLRGFRGALGTGVLLYVVFLVTNPVIWDFYYDCATLLLVAYLITQDSNAAEPANSGLPPTCSAALPGTPPA